MSIRSRLVLSLSLVVGGSGCRRAPADAAPGDARAEVVEGQQPDASGAAGSAAAAASDDASSPAAEPGGLAAAVDSIVQAEVRYPVALDPLLGLLPADSDSFVVIRDVEGLLATAEATLGAMVPSLRAFGAAAGGDTSREVEAFIAGYETLRTGLRGAGFSLDKGVAVGAIGDDAVVIYGAADPRALPTLMRAMGAEADDVPGECEAVAGAAGYVVCAERRATLDAYTPAEATASVRAALGTWLEPSEVERANLLARVGEGDASDQPMTLGIATPPGLIHVSIGVPAVPEPLAAVAGAGPSPALGLLAPGSGFYWLGLDPKGLAELSKEQPFIIKNILDTLTGEVVMGRLGEPPALVWLVGVDDPGPAAGLVGLAGLQLDQLPETLPDGSSVKAAVETLQVGSADAQVLHATLTPAGKTAELFASAGLTPEAWLFSVGGYLGVALGADRSVVDAIAGYAGGTMSAAFARGLPGPLAKDLAGRRVSMATHLPVDGLLGPAMTEAFAEIAAQLPAGERPLGMTPTKAWALVQSMIAPVSGLSVWMAPPRDRLVVHAALSLMGDPRTEEGRAALEVMGGVAAGGDAAALYGGLRERFVGSPRTEAYALRAGTRTDGVMISAVGLGVLSAIAIPAFTKYIERSKAAGAAASEAGAPAAGRAR